MLICDTHADTLYGMAFHSDERRDVTPDSLKKGCVNLQTLALFVGGNPDHAHILRTMEQSLAQRRSFIEAGIGQIDDPRDAREGTCAFMLSVEGCDLLEDDWSLLRAWRDIGVRIAALTWNHENACGMPAMKGNERLPAFGARAAKEMEKLGIAADVSHLCEKAFWDLLELGVTLMASHSCCRALCSSPRNLTDDQLKALFAAGGYVGVNFYPHFLCDDGRAALSDVARHIMHMLELGGEAFVGLGSDFDGIECKPDGLHDPSDLPALFCALREIGLTEKQIEGVAGRNLFDYFERVFPRGEA